MTNKELSHQFSAKLAEMVRTVLSEAGLPYGEVPEDILDLQEQLNDAVDDVINGDESRSRRAMRQQMEAQHGFMEHEDEE